MSHLFIKALFRFYLLFLASELRPYEECECGAAIGKNGHCPRCEGK